MDSLAGFERPLLMDQELAEDAKILASGLEEGIRNRLDALGNITNQTILTLLYTLYMFQTGISDKNYVRNKQVVIHRHTDRVRLDEQTAKFLLDTQKILEQYRIKIRPY